MQNLTLALIGFLSTIPTGSEVHIIEMVFPMYLLFLTPAIIIEWLVANHYFPNLSLSKIFWPIAAANILSTLVTTSITLTLIQIGTAHGDILLPTPSEIWNIMISIVKAPWHLHDDGEALTLIFHLVPTLFSIFIFYFMSVFTERFVLTKIFKTFTDKALIKKVCWKMNLASYGCFFILGFTTLALVTKGFGLL